MSPWWNKGKLHFLKVFLGFLLVKDFVRMLRSCQCCMMLFDGNELFEKLYFFPRKREKKEQEVV